MMTLLEKLTGTHKYLFADLDGTLIETISGKIFAKDKNDWRLKKDVIDAIKNYNPEFLYIVTNQGGIEKGFIKTNDFLSKIYAIMAGIQTHIPNLEMTYRFCASNDKKNPNRKPNPGMVNDLMELHRCKKYQCLMIGDASGKKGQFSDSDKMCAFNASIRYMDVNDFVKKYKS